MPDTPPVSPATFYLTTPIYYVNARPHIGHAYTTIVADVLARRHRLLGHDTFFLTGTDEHGQKIERSALAAGVPPQEFADAVSKSFRDLWDRLGITYDDYIRTTEPRHKQGVQRLFQTLKDRGYIYLSTYTGQYCVSDEAYVDGPAGIRCPDCGRVTETVSESNYYFKLSAFQLPLLDLIESGQLLITPDSRRNEVFSFLSGPIRDLIEMLKSKSQIVDAVSLQMSKLIQTAEDRGLLERTAAGTPYIPGALKDLSISRTSFKWGVTVPGNEDHVIYVWLDALANYMTAIGYGSDDPADIAKFERFWPADLHLVGKEIIRFHCVYWPAFLLAADLPTPKAITAHGWLLFDDSKMSKSKGNIVRTETILDTFGDHYRKEVVRLGQPEPTKADADLFASDVLRYFLLREIPFGQDGSFSFDALITRYNADLANGYGNLVSRTLSMLYKYFESLIPERIEVPAGIELIGVPVRERARGAIEQAVNLAIAGASAIEGAFESLEFSFAMGLVASAVSAADQMMSVEKPWKVDQSTPEGKKRVSDILYTAAESIRIITALLYPILPYATAKVWVQLGLGDIEQAAREGKLKDLQWGGLQPGAKLGPLTPIFPRADKGLAQAMADTESESSNPPRSSTDADSPADLSSITDAHDALYSEKTEFRESSLASAAGPTPVAPAATDGPYPARTSRFTSENTSSGVALPLDPTHPAAPPRTSGLPVDNPIAAVAGSTATTTERPLPPSHTEARPSGPFSTPASARPITADASAPVSGSSPQITIEDFAKVELRVAKILVCERIPKADKLLRLEVDLGPQPGMGRRQILSGIAEWYTPEDLIGRKIVVITNLAPRKMRGLESHGMLLAASTGYNGKPALATFADSDNIEVGARLK